MEFPWFKLVVVLVFVGRSFTIPLACSYNGTSYRERETVRTEEPCLSCTCQRGALECSLRVCAEYPDVLPPGCFLVHKPNDCCPQLFCEETFSPIGVELRTGYKLENKLHGNDCVINGSIYAEGSAVASSQVCEYCYCVEGEMTCIKPRCLQTFHGCKPIYEKSSCCPTHYDCRDADVDFLAEQVKNFVTSDSHRSLSILKSERENLTESETVPTDSTEPESEPPPPTTTTTTEEFSTEGTTAEAEESTTEHPTTLGFQTTITENPIKESTATTTTITEETTLTEETTTNFQRSDDQQVHIRSKLTLFEGTENPVASDNSSLEMDDYDSYDYSEPQLPPSLPNLVIFPFVAADAVVKEENVEPVDVYEKVGIERLDSHPVFYKDYFSPPLKTEGGFVPKEPSKPDEAFYDFNFFNKEQIESPSPNENAGSPPTSNQNCKSNGQEFLHQEIIPSTQNCVPCTCLHGKVVCQNGGCSSPHSGTNTSEPSTNTTWLVTPDPFGGIRNDSTSFPDSLVTKKPVTVTYKNFVLDFYPNYLITTTRGEFKIQPLENSVGESLYQSTPGEAVFGLVDETTPSPSVKEIKMSSTNGPSLFDEFLNSFLSDETATASTTTKRKYSAKVKAQTTTVKPEVMKPEVHDKTDSTKFSPGALLKLAGCNIYGMMYRVGKVITELSGPCLECLCTDLGVQCRPLKC